MTHERIALPVAAWLSRYNPAWFRSDTIAGLTAAAVVIPKAMACAVIAGLPVETGLYTALAAMAVYPILGTSRNLSVTTTSAIALMTAAGAGAVISQTSGADAVSIGVTLAFLTGLFLIAARILRLGFLANFISKPVLVGFEAGIGLVIAVSQLKSVLGIHPAGKTTLAILWELPGLLPQTHGLTLCVALAGIAILLFLPRFYPRIPASLVLVVAGISAASLFGLGGQGVDLVGAVPGGLPIPALPDFSLIGLLWPAALGIALMSFTESVAAARTFARQDDPAINPNQELVAVGIANAAAAFLGGFPSGGGTSQTAVNASAGARTQMSQWVTGLLVIICLLFLSKAIGLLPQAALGALVLVVSVSMIKPAKFRAIGRIRKDELAWAFITMAGVVLFGTLNGILIAVAISVLTLMFQANHPPVYAVAYNREKNFSAAPENTKATKPFPDC